ncbi:MAG: HTH domain-containing protein, partial [Bacteroidales bacterium]|nr:HTH domain-containing protein [Bacteroidales bacterium]
MNFLAKKQKLDYLLLLIQNGEGISADYLCERTCTSKRTLYRCINDLKLLGYSIGYSAVRRTYYFISKNDADHHNMKN